MTTWQSLFVFSKGLPTLFIRLGQIYKIYRLSIYLKDKLSKDMKSVIEISKNRRFGGLPETGIVDGETETLMAKPRSESETFL